MQFLDDSLLPENQQPLVIQVAPYGPEWVPADSTDIPVTMDEQVQKAVDCYNAGATLLHVHVREADGKGSKRMSMFNELLARLRVAVPDMILQVGGSISFAPETESEAAQWLSDDTRHMLAELTPKPDQVTIAINTNQMNICELLTADDVANTSLANPAFQKAYREMTIPSGPGFVEEHLRRLQANGIQPLFMLGDVGQLESVERLIRRGIYTGPLTMNWAAIGGGMDGPNPYNLMEFIRRVPDGAVLTIENASSGRRRWCSPRHPAIGTLERDRSAPHCGRGDQHWPWSRGQRPGQAGDARRDRPARASEPHVGLRRQCRGPRRLRRADRLAGGVEDAPRRLRRQGRAHRVLGRGRSRLRRLVRGHVPPPGRSQGGLQPRALGHGRKDAGR